VSDVKELHRELATLTSPFETISSFQIRLTTDVDPISSGVVSSSFDALAEIDATFSFRPRRPIKVSVSDRDLNGKQRTAQTYTIPWARFIHPSVAGGGATDDEGSSEGRRPNDEPAFGPVRVRLLYFPRSKNTVRGTELTVTELREFLDINEGVKIYRDNIRVLPYGDMGRSDGDWLALADRKTQNPAGAGRESFRIGAKSTSRRRALKPRRKPTFGRHVWTRGARGGGMTSTS